MGKAFLGPCCPAGSEAPISTGMKTGTSYSPPQAVPSQHAVIEGRGTALLSSVSSTYCELLSGEMA